MLRSTQRAIALPLSVASAAACAIAWLRISHPPSQLLLIDANRLCSPRTMERDEDAYESGVVNAHTDKNEVQSMTRINESLVTNNVL
ncbi:hypothetical protein [Lysobacter capsici]|uniref:hypothetical protein n=1 Tax=Lysobacter capsici TaxID=435897 RepID=UPI001C001EC8|nr:hypothetical protein [Lysobacter capsici]QWF17397.1 hypothetical protein KME82_00905 [Lysobacter capsici]